MTVTVALLSLVLPGCDSSGSPAARGPEGSTPSSSVASTPDAASLDTSEACSFIASTVQTELTRWTGSDEIVNAPVAETRLGPQPSGGVPGILVDGCVWEARGPDGGHIGVAVERFTSVDLGEITEMAGEESVESVQLTDGRQRWAVPPSGESPSGAVVVGDSNDLVVVRVESYSDNVTRTFISETRDGSSRFFGAVGDALEASSLR